MKIEEDKIKMIDKLKALPKPRKTFMEIMKVHKSEVHMSNVLAFFFRPDEKHGLGDLLLRSLLKTEYYELNKKKNCKTSFKSLIDDSVFKNVKVRTEVSTDRTNNAPKDTSKFIDILIEAEKFVICIEFKINHKLNNPLESYFNFVEGVRFDETGAKNKEIHKNDNKEKVFIVLTPIWKKPEGPALAGEPRFKQIILSHLIGNVLSALPSDYFIQNADNIHIQYFTDFVQTVHNRSTEFKVKKIISEQKYDLETVPFIKSTDELGRFWINKINEYKLKELKKLIRTATYHTNDKGGFLQLKKNSQTIKVRIIEDKWCVENWTKDNQLIKEIAEFEYTTCFVEINEALKKY